MANILPGATAVQLGIFLGYARGGWWGGLLGGVCFVLPVFFVITKPHVGNHQAPATTARMSTNEMAATSVVGLVA